MPIAGNMLELVGATPMVWLDKISKGLPGRIAAKVESRNPGGSVKDRIALNMVLDAEERGLLAPGATIIEPTSGNTGIGLALVAAVRGYRLILTMPDTMSPERKNLMRAYGAEIVLTPGADGMAGAVAKAMELNGGISGSYIPQQFENPANPAMHMRTTALEIWEDTQGAVDVFVAGVGTGGTVTGVSRVLKEKRPGLVSIAVEPEDSPLISQGRAGSHRIQGIGANFVPAVFDRGIVDEIMTAGTENSYAMARRLAREEGILAGISSGAAVWAAQVAASRPGNEGKVVVVLLPDTGERYLSTPLWQE